MRFGRLIFLFLLFLDVGTKFLTFSYVPKMSWMDMSYPYGGIPIFHNFLGGVSFSVNHAENLGAAWGIFSSYSDYLFLFRIIVVLFLVIYIVAFPHGNLKKNSLLLIATGAVGNILDRFFYGHVIDMLHFNFWGYTFPIFNVADAMITCGISLLFLLSILEKNEKKKLA